jgi:integrase
VDTYGRGDVTAFLDLLRQMPALYGRSPKDKDLSLQQLISRAEAEQAKRLAEKTVKRHLSALAVFFKYAVDKGYMTVAARAEMVDDRSFKTNVGARDQRDAWTSEELKKLFASPVWTGCHPTFRSQAGPEIIRDAFFWLPLLALFHGARLEEFADLYRRDVIKDGATWAIKIVATAEDPETGQKARRLKTLGAARTIPLHPELIRLGFLDYVQETAPGPNDPLFPDIAPQGPDGKRGPRVTRWFVEYRKTIGLYRPGVGMHAMRHTAITRLTDSIKGFKQKRHRDFMMGHAAGGTQGDVRYDKGDQLAQAAATLALLKFPEINLSHLYVGS